MEPWATGKEESQLSTVSVPHKITKQSGVRDGSEGERSKRGGIVNNVQRHRKDG